jgi:hypothetical protein
MAISAYLVHHHRALFGLCAHEIPLSITLHIQARDCNPARHWLLPDGGVDFLAPPGAPSDTPGRSILRG